MSKFQTCINMSVFGVDTEVDVVYTIDTQHEVHVVCLYICDIDLDLTNLLEIDGVLDKVLELIATADVIAECIDYV